MRALVHPEDAAWIETAIDQWAASLRWDLRGEAVSPPLLQALLWDDVARQQVLLADGQSIGLLQMTGFDLVNGLANLEVLLDAGSDRLAPDVDGFLHDAFGSFPLRKVMLHVGGTRLDVGALLGEGSEFRAHRAASYAAHLHAGGASYRPVEVFEILPAERGRG